jgi:hypothetical protein
MVHLNRTECGETGESWIPKKQRSAPTSRVCVFRQQENNTAANFVKKLDPTKPKSLAIAAIPLAPHNTICRGKPVAGPE